jgi:hypothetical protein
MYMEDDLNNIPFTLSTELPYTQHNYTNTRCFNTSYY